MCIRDRYYGSLYQGFKTDTAQIRSVICHARDICAIFASTDWYIKYMLSDVAPQTIDDAEQWAADIVAARTWFSSQASDIKEYTGVVYHENFGEWEGILSQLERFNGIVSAVGEDTGYAMAVKYYEDHTLIDDYLAVLQQITLITEYAQSVYHVAADKDDINMMDIKQLIGDIRTIISNAQLLKSVYDFFAVYCPEEYSKLRVAEVKGDLNAILLYQDTRDNLSDIEDEAREKLGEEYRDVYKRQADIFLSALDKYTVFPD